MCGFSGVVFTNEIKYSRDRFLNSASRLSHRGDSDSREIFYPRVWLKHYRLAFQDPKASIQPQLSTDGAYTIIFNGEIYNHQSLRPEISRLTGHEFKTNGDTETILAGFLAHGAEIVTLLEGEFSFVITKIDGTELFAARDYFGVKPLFFRLEGIDTKLFAVASQNYTCHTPTIEFASEIKGLSCEKKWNSEGAIRQFVGLFEPIRTPFDEVIQCPPAGTIFAKRVNESFEVKVTMNKTSIRRSTKRSLPQEELTVQFLKALESSTKERLLSDVELGIYLSGGVDSRSIAWQLKELGQKKIQSFTVGFEEEGFDESDESRNFSLSLGFNPHILKLSQGMLEYAYPHAVYNSENLQPYTNGSAKWWLSRFTRQYVKGVFTGDGADEVFCGYPSFRYAAWWKFRSRNNPSATVKTWRDDVYLKRYLSDSANPWLAASGADGKGLDFVESLNIWGIHHPLYCQILSITSALMGSTQKATEWLSEQKQSVASWFAFGFENADSSFLKDPENTLLLWQNYFCHTHLPVQILNWVGDRMEMANTLEGRPPYLSSHFRKLVYELGDADMVAGFTDKAIQRKSLPKKLVAPKKKQFNAPFIAGALLKKFDVETIFERSGFGIPHAYHLTQSKISKENMDPFERVHLQSFLQTALATSIVDSTIIHKNVLLRDHIAEEKFLKVSLSSPGPII